MKTFASALITLILIIAIVAANGHFVKGLTEEIIAGFERSELSGRRDVSYRETLSFAGEELSRNLNLLSLSVGKDETEELFCLIAEAQASLGNDEAQFRTSVVKLIRALKRIKAYHTFCPDVILTCTRSHRLQEADGV